MKKSLAITVFLFSHWFTFAQNNWPKSYAMPGIYLYNVIEDVDHGFLAVAQYNYDGNTYLLKFDANANLLWQKCLHYTLSPELWVTHFVKDRFKNTYLIGCTYDTDPASGDAFILQLDSVYNKVKGLVLTDTVSKEQQYLGCSFDFSDSLVLINGWGFNKWSNSNLLFIKKSDFGIKSILNSSCGSGYNNQARANSSNYYTWTDWHYLKGGDTNLVAIRAPLLKIDTFTQQIKFYKFFGFDNNLLSSGYKLFLNSKNNLFVFSGFISVDNNVIHNKIYSPMIFECDTNGKSIRYGVFNDLKINQEFSDVIKFDDSLYYLSMSYTENSSGLNAVRKIKILKFLENGARPDSIYLNNNGKNNFINGSLGCTFLIKTFDNKIMCVINEVDSNFSHPRISFVRLDANLKKDTTEYKNLQYDFGIKVPNDTITLSGSPIAYLHTDSTYQMLKFEKPNGVITLPVVNQYSFYPNPVKESATLNFQNPHNEFVELVLFNSEGKFIQEMYAGPGGPNLQENISIHFKLIPTGIYFIKVFVGHHLQHTIKIVKEN